MLSQNRKSQSTLTGTILIIILNALIFAGALLVLSRAGAGADIIEKIYSRQIALTIDNLRPGTEITMYLPEVFDNAKKNNFKGNIFSIDFEKSIVTVAVADGGGQSFGFGKKPCAGPQNSFHRRREMQLQQP